MTHEIQGKRSITHERLLQLYEKHESVIFEIGENCSKSLESGQEMHGPFLITPHDSYYEKELKVAFVGQETNGWPTESILEQMETYNRFNLGEKYRSTPFWDVIREIEWELVKSKYTSAWLNINRYDQNGGRPSEGNRCTLSRLDFLLLEELKLIKPDIIIFFTGPVNGYDHRILNLLEGTRIEVDGFKKHHLCKIETSKLDSMVFCAYHPSYLRRSGLGKTVIPEIVRLCQA